MTEPDEKLIEEAAVQFCDRCGHADVGHKDSGCTSPPCLCMGYKKSLLQEAQEFADALYAQDGTVSVYKTMADFASQHADRRVRVEREKIADELEFNNQHSTRWIDEYARELKEESNGQ